MCFIAALESEVKVTLTLPVHDGDADRALESHHGLLTDPVLKGIFFEEGIWDQQLGILSVILFLLFCFLKFVNIKLLGETLLDTLSCKAFLRRRKLCLTVLVLFKSFSSLNFVNSCKEMLL